jgi:hypothetical protein
VHKSAVCEFHEFQLHSDEECQIINIEADMDNLIFYQRLLEKKIREMKVTLNWEKDLDEL